MKSLHQSLRKYWSFRDELSLEDGIILKGNRIVIAEQMQAQILSKLHEAHQGMNKTKLRAKETVYWYNINEDIENMCSTCTTCQKYQPSQAKEPRINHDIPERPWQVLGSDLFYFKGTNYLIVADYYSKFPIIKKLPSNCTSYSVIEAMKQIFGEYGIPENIISDNGPQYDLASFKEFSNDWEFEHITSSPHYPQSNGFAESQVKIVKKVLQKATDTGRDNNSTLLCICTTPIDHRLPSPAELLFGRPIQSNLSAKITNNREDKDSIHDRFTEKQVKQKQQYDRHAKELPKLSTGQEVSVYDHPTGKWIPATIVKESKEPRSYVLKTVSGAILRRNRKHIKKRNSNQKHNKNCAPHGEIQNQNADNQACNHTGATQPESILRNQDSKKRSKLHVRFNLKPQQKTSSGRNVRKPQKMDL